MNGIDEVLSHPWLRSIVYNIKKENNNSSPFYAFVQRKTVIGSQSPSHGYVNEIYTGEDLSDGTPRKNTRYFDFSFRLSVDKPEEFNDLEEHQF